MLSEQLAAQIAELEAELAAVLPVTQTRHEEREMAAFEAPSYICGKGVAGNQAGCLGQCGKGVSGDQAGVSGAM